MPRHTETIEDRIAAADDDYPANHTGKSARWPYSYVGDDVPEDLHERRYQNVIEGEKKDLASPDRRSL